MDIILASKSPRRKELMSLLNLDFKIVESNVDETIIPNITLEEQSKHLAYIKAKNVFDKTMGDRIVIGSDTLVYKSGKYYGKPNSTVQAFEMVRELKNSVHQISTGLAILVQVGDIYEQYLDCDISNIYIGDMSDYEINEWINSGKAMDKAGAYAIQEEFAKFIDRIEGNYISAVGLPINKVYKILKQYKYI